MYATNHLKANEFNEDFFNALKYTFKGKDIEISISDFDETEYLLKSPKKKEIILERIRDVKENKNLIFLTLEEIEREYTD